MPPSPPFRKTTLTAQQPAVRSTLAQTPGLGVTTRGLHNPDGPATHTAVRFDIGLGEDCTPEAHADFAARVIEAVTPVVDGVREERGFG